MMESGIEVLSTAFDSHSHFLGECDGRHSLWLIPVFVPGEG